MDAQGCVAEVHQVRCATADLRSDEPVRGADQGNGQPCFAHRNDPWPPRFLDKWRDLTVPELKVFLGLSYGFGLARLPRLRDYWCTNKLFFHFPHLRRFMPRDRFFAIKRCLHFVNNKDGDVDRTDPFNKVRPLLQALARSSKELYQPGENLSLDEMMQCCHNRSCPGVVFRPPNKKTNGIKVWAICEAQTGYCCAFRVAYKDGPSVSDTVFSLAGDLVAPYHRIHMDNLFTKPKVFTTLLEARQYACGTWRANYGVPKVLRPDENKDLGKGKFRWRTAGGRLFATVWRDSKVLNLLSTYHGPEDTGSVYRRESGHHGRKAISAPMAAVHYNMYMGAVDECDSLRASYTTARASTRWYLALFYWWLDMTAIQSMVVYRDLGNNITHAEFVHALAVALLLDGSGEEAVHLPDIRKRRKTAAPRAGGPRLPRGMHLVRCGEAYRRCYRCRVKYGREARTQLSCESCRRVLCKRCFYPYHHEPELWG